LERVTVATPVAASKSIVYAFSSEAAAGVGVVAGFAGAVVAPAALVVPLVVAFCADAAAMMPRRRTKTCKQKRWDRTWSQTQTKGADMTERHEVSRVH